MEQVVGRCHTMLYFVYWAYWASGCKWFLNILCNHPVSGEANFAIKHTGLTVGGFMQPSVTTKINLIENQLNMEKGLCQNY